VLKMFRLRFVPPLWAFLTWWERHQKWWWVMVCAITLAWLSYDIGRIVTRAGLVNLEGRSEGAVTIPEVLEKATAMGGGRIIVTGSNSARFIDRSGAGWEIPGFGDQVSRGDLKKLDAAHVIIDGDVQVDLRPVKTNPRDIALSAAFDVAMKLAFLGIFAMLMYFILKALAGNNDKRFRSIQGGNRPDVRIADVAGHHGPKLEVTEIVDYLRAPERFVRVGARPPRGVLLYGEPGNGKTLLAKAIAGEAASYFIEQNASSFMQIYVGAGAQAVRRLFAEARKHRPCVIFIDEIDAIGATRSGPNSHDERVQSLNALLSEMDGLENNEGLVVVAATNRLEVLDPALIRPGRFDRKVFVPMPSRQDRREILDVHLNRLPSVNVDRERWAEQTGGFSGADLAGLVNEAAIEAARASRDGITDQDMSQARDRVLMGAVDINRRLSDQDRHLVCIHELGHAAVRLAFGQKVEKVSIQPRGRSLGSTLSTPGLSEGGLFHREDVARELRVMLGGRAAEAVLVGKTSAGSEDDVARASQLARQALHRFGWGKLGAYVPQSESLQKDAEMEAAQWVNEALAEAQVIIELRRASIESLVPLLLKSDELDGEALAVLRDPSES
jgi:cell division protease FtsH